MAKLEFATAAQVRDALTHSTLKQIRTLYNQWADEIGERADYYAKLPTPSSAMQEREMRELEKQLKQAGVSITEQALSGIKGTMVKVADASFAEQSKWLQSLGFAKGGIDAAFTNVPERIVERLVTGKVYKGGWSLADAIWGDNEDTLSKLYAIIAGGMARNEGTYKIAKDLERFVRPDARKDWNLRDKDGRKIYPKQVDYNAQRLARTLSQHAYQQGFVESTKDNPFITKYIWRSNGSRVCEVCKKRDGKVYSKDDLPLDHPNGMCVMEPVVSETMTDDLAAWARGENTDPAIDKFAKKFGYDGKAPASDAINALKAGSQHRKPSVSAKKKPAKVTYQKFKSANAAHEWSVENIYDTAWSDKLSDTEKQAFRTYTDEGYTKINKYLRGTTDKVDSDVAKTAGDLSAALSRTSISKNVMVTRGVGDDAVLSKLLGIGVNELAALLADNPNNLVGTTMTDKGFMSTTVNPRVSSTFEAKFELKLNVPKGTHGAYVAPISTLVHEHELLLDKGTSIRVDSVKKKSEWRYVINATVVQ